MITPQGWKRLLQKLGILTVAASASLFPASVPAKRPSAEEDEENTIRPFGHGVIGENNPLAQGEFFPMADRDEYLHRYGRLDQMISCDVSPEDSFWVKVDYKLESDSVMTLTGTRNDGRTFYAHRKIEGPERLEFDLLCDAFNGFLSSGIEARTNA